MQGILTGAVEGPSASAVFPNHGAGAVSESAGDLVAVGVALEDVATGSAGAADAVDDHIHPGGVEGVRSLISRGRERSVFAVRVVDARIEGDDGSAGGDVGTLHEVERRVVGVVRLLGKDEVGSDTCGDAVHLISSISLPTATGPRVGDRGIRIVPEGQGGACGIEPNGSGTNGACADHDQLAAGDDGGAGVAVVADEGERACAGLGEAEDIGVGDVSGQGHALAVGVERDGGGTVGEAGSQIGGGTVGGVLQRAAAEGDVAAAEGGGAVGSDRAYLQEGAARIAVVAGESEHTATNLGDRETRSYICDVATEAGVCRNVEPQPDVADVIYRAAARTTNSCKQTAKSAYTTGAATPVSGAAKIDA